MTDSHDLRLRLGHLPDGSPDELVVRLVRIDRAASTNDVVRELWQRSGGDADAVPALLTVETAEQTAGRGRRGREWVAPAGKCLAVSTIVRIPAGNGAREHIGWLPLVAGLALRDAILQAAPDRADDVRIKWPNDVLVDGRKTAGILGEVLGESGARGKGAELAATADEGPRVDPAPQTDATADEPAHTQAEGKGAELGEPAAADARADEGEGAELVPAAPASASGPDLGAVIGTGINLLLAEDELPVPTATSLALSGIPVSGRELVGAYLTSLAARVRRLLAASGDADASGLRAELVAACATVGVRVRAVLPGGDVLVGEAIDIAPTGELVIRDDAGRVHAIAAGDVERVRPEGVE